jgi:mRNA interferase RelE/StbE
VQKLAGHENLYRVRAGDWRISYAAEAERLVLLVLEIAPRGGAYRNL